VSVVGHTFNSDLWSPKGEDVYFRSHRKKKWDSSVAFVDYFLVNDDNFGMYMTMSSHTLDKRSAQAFFFPEPQLGDAGIMPVAEAATWSVGICERS
jgi:hypothetical protein